jgi:hypothetical protein
VAQILSPAVPLLAARQPGIFRIFRLSAFRTPRAEAGPRLLSLRGSRLLFGPSSIVSRNAYAVQLRPGNLRNYPVCSVNRLNQG